MLSTEAVARLRATMALPFTVSAVPGTLVLAAPAKVNLFLEILGKRPDGYHTIETLLHAINLFDTLEFRADPVPGPIELRCEPEVVPGDASNLVWRAAEALRQACGVGYTASIRLSKRIPHEAGLGGGSSDAAMTLLGLNALWGLHRPIQELREIAATLGSDLGAFLTPPAGWCTGRGEIVEPEWPGRVLHLVVVKPPFGLSTAAVYRQVQVPAQPVSGRAARLALRSGDLFGIAAQLHNRLQEAAFQAEPRVEQVYQQLQACQPLGVLLSGSGSCVLALARDAADAVRLARDYRQRHATPGSIYVVQTIHSMAQSLYRPL